MRSSQLKNRLLIAGGLAAVLGMGLAVYLALSTWGQVNRVDIDRPDPDLAGELVQEPAEDEDSEPSSSDDDDAASGPDPAPNTDGTEVFLLVGSDSREALSDTSGFGEFEGRRADVVMVVMRAHGETAVMSLPRDLWVESVCGGEMTRLNEELEGCSDLFNGPSLLTLTVESLLGEAIDHIALVDLAGFQEAVDELGGYEICLERPVRDELADLQLPAGCTMASGEQALAWLRSRHTQELTESGWRVVPGVNDLARNERQRDFLIDMMGRLSDFGSPQALASTARAISPHITVDSDLSLVTAVELAWALRGIGEGDVTELEVPVVDHTTDEGAAVLLASTPVRDLVSQFLAPETAGEFDPVIES